MSQGKNISLTGCRARIIRIYQEPAISSVNFENQPSLLIVTILQLLQAKIERKVRQCEKITFILISVFHHTL